jgi:hypothetical protein
MLFVFFLAGFAEMLICGTIREVDNLIRYPGLQCKCNLVFSVVVPYFLVYFVFIVLVLDFLCCCYSNFLCISVVSMFVLLHLCICFTIKFKA